MTTTTTSDELANVPLPPGAEADTWQDDQQPYRVIYRVSRGLTDRDDVVVSTTAIQLPDGRIDDGTYLEPPHVRVDSNSDRGLTSAQARALAAAILDECADEIDRWSTR